GLPGRKGASRQEFRADDEAGEAGIYLLEVNTQPGMTPLSLVPEQAKYRGISYGELVERLILEGLGGARLTSGAGVGADRRLASLPVTLSRRRLPRPFRSTRRAPTGSPGSPS